MLPNWSLNVLRIFDRRSSSGSGRRGYGIEIDPLYVDTAITRWERLTGNQARHATGRTFADIKAERKITP
jgi:hypothetical protein